MPVECRGICGVCDYPIAVDPYIGCSHNCKYCFVKQQHGLNNISPVSCEKALKSFINGHRTRSTTAFDWNIPIKVGTTTDPLQPCELEFGQTLKLLKIFAETKYPFILLTKRPNMLLDEPYLSVIRECNCVLRVSAACSKYDNLEPGAPTYEERIQAISQLSKIVTRINISLQPFFTDCFKDIMQNIPRYADVGAYGVTVEGYHSPKKQKGLIKDGKYCFPIEVLAPMYKSIQAECHKYGLRFFSGEDRLRFLGDDLTCCGTEGLETFKPNKFNIQHLAHDKDIPKPTKAMERQGTAYPFLGRKHKTSFFLYLKTKSFADMMHEIGDDYVYWYQELRRKWGD